jgi:hypothetical protein
MNLDILQRSTLVLIVDCFHDQSDPILDQTWQNIVKLCQNPHVTTICLAAHYDETCYHVIKEEPWWANSNQLFGSETKWDFLKKDWSRFAFRDHDVKDDHLGFPKYIHSSAIIRDMKVRNDQTQLMISNTLQLSYYCNYVNPSIENLLLVGRAWEVCLQNRSVGWHELNYCMQYRMLGQVKNIYTKKDCVLTVDQKRPEIQTPWYPIGEQIYYLDHKQANINN